MIANNLRSKLRFSISLLLLVAVLTQRHWRIPNQLRYPKKDLFVGHLSYL